MKQISNLILASGSPRRKQLLEEAGFAFSILKLDVEESYPAEIDPKDIAIFLAEKKSKAALERIGENDTVITADTVVVCDGQIFEKPAERSEAVDMLKGLSGKTHQVITGVCIANSKKSVSISSLTNVTFKDLSEDEITYYIDNFHPYDKAGAYGIQDWIGLACVTSIEGSYFNVVGLPVSEVYEVIQNW